MFDFYIPCVRVFSVTKNCFYWRPLKIYTSRSSCIRFLRSYKHKTFEFHDYGIVHLTQDVFFIYAFSIVFLNEVSDGKD